MSIESLGEFGLIHRIAAICRKTAGKNRGIILPLGDDAAVFACPEHRVCVQTTDALSEGVHFDLSYTSFYETGWKAAAANISDVAAMGAEPAFAVVSIGIADTWHAVDIEDLYRGMAACMDRYTCAIIGGDTVRSAATGYISITVTGFAAPERVATRGAARPGDSIWVTGRLGGSMAGLEILSKGGGRGEYAGAVEKFLLPVPRVEAGAALVSEYNVACMIDISDGLGSELNHIAKQSGVGAEVYADALPVCRDAAVWAEKNRSDPLSYALSSGEEYELLFTVNIQGAEKLRKSDFSETLCPVTEIGVVTEHRECVLKTKAGTVPIASSGWNHFTSDE